MERWSPAPIPAIQVPGRRVGTQEGNNRWSIAGLFLVSLTTQGALHNKSALTRTVMPCIHSHNDDAAWGPN